MRALARAIGTARAGLVEKSWGSCAASAYPLMCANTYTESADVDSSSNKFCEEQLDWVT